jgi:hypothetical protein
MSKEHKQALALGRDQGRAVRRYLEALDEHKPKRGRKRTPDSIKKRLDTIANQMNTADPLTRVHRIQEQMDLEAELENKQAVVDLSALEEGFVEVAADYGERRGISYAAWRQAGVAAEVLKRAGISRGA